MNSRSGQSLIEILLATIIGAVIISSVAGLLVSILRISSDAGKIQISAGLAKELFNEVQNYSQNNWYNIYNLAKGGTPYYLVATGTTFEAVTGTESVAVAKSDILTGLVGEWSFDEATGSYAYDSSGNSNLGTIYYATRQTGSNCVAGGCLSFNGSTSNIVLPANFNWTGSTTINAWIYPLDTTQGMIFVKSDSWGMYILSAPTSIQVGAIIGGNGYYPTTAAGTLPVNQWSMVTAVYDGAHLYAYINGVDDASSSASGALRAGGQSEIGYFADTNTRYFNGYIDDVSIYNTALSATTIKNLYSAQYFTRNFTVSNVNRDSNGFIATYGTDDPATQLINISYSWPNGSTSTIAAYLTRYLDQVTYQNNWSGGPNQTGPITIPNNLFASSTYINYNSSTGAIIIQGF
ncbi:MAG: LamG domain-containing protein [Patescibacteria group bacterium]|nr:LamG domain-containing protein [Patescibacteria group bacterium]